MVRLHILSVNTAKDVITVIERALLFIILLRVISGSIEISAAALMYKFNDLEKAFYINSLLALVGPVILVVTTGIALSGLTEKISLTRMVCLFAGVLLILYSLKAK
ncbi:YqhV family protein [Sporosarcina aquimarina]|uniref:YqhV family protein n=1 Tax=Sporosarcina aquimarina TaxID=114975 RepID=UPI00255A04E5|nr:YqhV family protein [Sporosarcina aquimarina]